jgi:hypothetical protein
MVTGQLSKTVLCQGTVRDFRGFQLITLKLTSPTNSLLDVIVEFGHNDGGSLTTSDRADVYGADDSVSKMVTLANGTVEVVHTFG